MSLKVKMDLELSIEDFKSELEAKLNQATAATTAVTAEKAQAIASQRLRKGLKWWEGGFKIDKAADGAWILSISGKLANMMEEGFGPGAISQMILQGNRYKANLAQKKNYVDVPFELDVQGNSVVNLLGTKVRISKFTNADEMVKEFSFSDPSKKEGIRKESRIVTKNKIQDIIRSRKSEDSKAQFISFRRLTPSSIWPKHPFSGAKALDSLDAEIETAFEAALQKVL